MSSKDREHQRDRLRVIAMDAVDEVLDVLKEYPSLTSDGATEDETFSIRWGGETFQCTGPPEARAAFEERVKESINREFSVGYSTPMATAEEMRDAGFNMEARILEDVAKARVEAAGKVEEFNAIKEELAGREEKLSKSMDHLALKLATITALLQSEMEVDVDGDVTFNVDRTTLPDGVDYVFVEEHGSREEED